MEISEIARQLKHAIERGRRATADRRQRTDAAAVAYQTFLERIAVPLFKQVANALRAENIPFQVFTPGGGLRLASDRTAEDFIELALDVSGDRPFVLGRVSYARGSRVLSHESAIRSDREIGQLTDEDVFEFLLREIPPFIGR